MSSLTPDKHAQLTTERITKTAIYKYDQITAVSQGSINRQLEHMHSLYEVLQKLNIHQEDDEDMGLVDCVLDAPQVMLHTGVNKQRVTYYIRIKVSGILEQRFTRLITDDRVAHTNIGSARVQRQSMSVSMSRARPID